MRRRLAAPARNLRREHAVAALGRIETADLGQRIGPVAAQDLEEQDDLLPVFRMLAWDERFELGELAARDLHLVEKPGERSGERRRLSRRQRPRALDPPPAQHEPRQHQAAAQLRHGGRRVDVAVIALVAEERKLVRIEIADRHEPRQQQRLPFARAQERLAQRAHRAPGRQQDGVARESGRIAAAFVEKPFGERVEERLIGRDIVNPRHSLSARSAACRAAPRSRRGPL